MKISKLLTQETMILNLESTNKNDVINEMTKKLDHAGKLADLEGFRAAIHAREEQSTTGIGEGVAIPHAKSEAVKEPVIVFGRSKSGIDYEALDGQPSYLFFMIAVPEGANNEHLDALSRLSSFLMHEEFRKDLLEAEDEAALEKVIINKEEAEDGEEEEEQTKETDDPSESSSKTKILAVTACPTGIAHTFMAADSLKDKAKELGYDIKVQTNGSGGVKNRLTSEEIEEAAGIIVAASTKVDLTPFKGKRVVEVPVTDGIRNPEKLIQQVIHKEAPIYNGDGGNRDGDDSSSQQSKEKSGFYKHIMNGVSNMLPLVVGGGLIIALSFAVDFEGNNPIAKMLMEIGGNNAFQLLVPILAGFIAMSIADRPGLAPGLVGGMMAYTGGSGFLGGLIAGFLAGYVIVFLKSILKGLPDVLDGLKPVLFYPLFGILITGIVMYWINLPLEAFNLWLQDVLGNLGTGNAVLLGIIVGGMMAVDMGGPINKAAYTFGLALIEGSTYGPMAAIMAGGMVPPLGMALSTTLFKNKFNKQEREAGKTAYVLGASFITEGAIPFAAQDPGRVIPASVIGSAIAGGLAMLFGASSRVPHGGIFVFFAIENFLMWILSVIAGAIVTAIIVGIWKSKKA